MSSKASGQGEPFIEFVDGRVVVFMMRRFCLFCSPHGNDKMICNAAIIRETFAMKAKNLAGKCSPPDSDPFSDAEFGKNRACLSMQSQLQSDYLKEGTALSSQ